MRDSIKMWFPIVGMPACERFVKGTTKSDYRSGDSIPLSNAGALFCQLTVGASLGAVAAAGTVLGIYRLRELGQYIIQ